MNMIEMCICGTIMIIWILLLRRVLGKRIPRLFFVLFWWAALIRLLLPFHISLPHSPTGKVTNLIEDTYDKADALIAQMNPTVTEYDPEEKEAAVLLQKDTSSKRWWVLFWIVGSCTTASCIVFQYIRNIRKFGKALPTDMDWEKKWIDKYSLHRHVRIKSFDRISSPLTYGVLRPVILLPSGMPQADMNFDQVLKHEFEHIKHFDTLAKILLLVAASLYWFDPFVWIMVYYFNKDIELYTDEKVIQDLAEEDRWKYAKTLAMFADKQQRSLIWGQGFGENAVLERVRVIFSFRKKKKVTFAIGTLFLIALLLPFFLKGDSRNQRMLRNVQKYNERIQEISYHDPWNDFTYAEDREYEELSHNKDGIMGTITIPSIGLEEGIYLGTDQTNMLNGVMHVSGSFLPGDSAENRGTNIIIAGHNGLVDKTMFTELHTVETGAPIVISTYGKSWVYRVTDIKTIMPEEYSADVKNTENMLTLITPVPYGVNTHRLIVIASLE